jgi:hypothetical protein
MPKTTRSRTIFAAEVGAHIKLRTTLRTQRPQVYQAIRSALDETMIDVLARNPEFQTIDAPRMVRWSF